MAKSHVAEFDDQLLASESSPSDRFVFANYYVPILLTPEDDDTPLLTFYQKQILIDVLRSRLMTPERFAEILKELGYGELWQRNSFAEAVEDEETPMTRARMPAEGRVHEAAPQEARRTVLRNQDVEFVAELLRSDIGYAFLDRTRIRPVGFALGEHVYALSLAPGEEVTLEQKTFTKRQVTLEEASEQERLFDIELASTLSTELQEGFERQRSLTDNWGLNLSHTGQYTSPMTQYGQFIATHSIAYTKNVTDASSQTARRSVKDSQTSSSKVSARYRTLHKTTFRIVSEQGFEATSKRTIRNPNRTTSLTLHYFKVLQRLQMQQERYGVRLCWAASVKDPAFTFFEKIRKGREKILQDSRASLPAKPVEPQPPAPAQDVPPAETKWFNSEVIVADKWGFTGDMRADYDVDIAFDNDFEWDYDLQAVKDSLQIFTRRKQEDVSRWIVGLPTPRQEDGYKLRVKVHIGAPSWVGGPGISFQVGARGRKKVTVTQDNSQNAKYNDDLATYRTHQKEWQDKVDATLEQAEKEAKAFEERMLRGLSPISEMVSQIIQMQFPPNVRDECWEIDYWQRLFDWERASFVPYPGWWSSGESRDPERDPTDFINASWAKLYLPVRPGMEQFALRWIFGKSVTTPVHQDLESMFTAIVEDLTKYRTKLFGSADEAPELAGERPQWDEKFLCIANWNEVMPTDGTHIEVVQGASNAADAITAKEIEGAQDLREALLESEKRSAKLKDKAYDQMKNPADINVNIDTGGTGEG